MRLTEGLDSGPVALAERVADRADDDYGALSRAARGARRRAAARGARRARAGASSSSPSRTTRRRPTPRRSSPAERRLDPARPAIELERRVRALTPHIGAYLELEGGERLGVGRGPRRAGRARPGDARRRPTACGSAAARASCGCSRSARRRAADGRRRLPARPRAAAPARERRGRRPRAGSPTRSCGAPSRTAPGPTARSPRRPTRARARRPRARAGAAARLRRGPAARHHRPPDRRARRAARRPASTPPRSPRCASACSSSSTPRPPTTPPSTRRSSSPRAGSGAAACRTARARAASGFVNAVLRRAAAEREELLGDARRLDRRGGGGRPLLSAVARRDCGGRELGADEARLLMAAMNEPAETALRVNTLRADPAGRRRRAARRPGWRSPGPAPAIAARPGGRRSSSDRAGEPVGARIATGELVPQSRGLAGGGRAARSAAGRAGARPLRRPGDQDDRRSRRGWATAARSSRSRSDPRRAAEVERALRARRGQQRPRRGRRRGRGRPRRLATIASSWTRPAQTSERSPRGPTRAGASRPDDPERLAALQRRLLVRAARALAPGGTLVYSTCTISAPRERGGRRGARRATRAGSRPTTSVPPIRRLASRRGPPLPAAAARSATARRVLLRPLQDGAADGRRAHDPTRPTAPAAASRGCARPSFPGRYRCVYCLRRYELVSGCPNCGEHQTMVRMSADEDLLCQHCGHSMLQPV